MRRAANSLMGYFRNHASHQEEVCSIPSSAASNSDGGAWMPSAFAVFRLMIAPSAQADEFPPAGLVRSLVEHKEPGDTDLSDRIAAFPDKS
jgi:hypothetical protein